MVKSCRNTTVPSLEILMTNKLVLALVALFATVTLAEAQDAPQPAPASGNGTPAIAKSRPRPIAFVKPGTPNLDTIAGQVAAIRSCDDPAKSPFRLSCAMLVATFNANPAFDEIGDVADKDELADLYEGEAEMRPCPATTKKVPIAALQGDKVVYLERFFQENEPCVIYRRTNQVLAAAPCTQFVGEKLAAFTIQRQETLTDQLLEAAKEVGADAPGTSSDSSFTLNPAGQPKSQSCGGFFDTCRKTGKAFWFVVVPLAVAGGVACAIDNCLGDTVVQKVCIGPNCR